MATFSFNNLALEQALPTTHSNWESWTPTGSWSTNTTYVGRRRRVGDTREYAVEIQLAGAPTSAALTVNILETIDTAKLTSTDLTQQLGTALINDNGAGNYVGAVRYNNTTSVAVFHVSGTPDTLTATTQAAPITFGASDRVYLKFSVPIVGLSV